MKPPFSYIPLLPPLLAVVAGVLLCDYVTSEMWFGFVLLAFVCIFFAKRLRPFLPVIGAVLLGWVVAVMARPDLEVGKLLDNRSVYTAEVKSAKETDYGYRIFADIYAQDGNNINTIQSVLYVQSLEQPFSSGDIIDFKADFDGLDTKTDLPDELNIDENYIRQGFDVKAYPLEDSIRVTGRVGGLKGWLYDIKTAAIDRLVFSDLSEDLAAFLAATIFGDTSLLHADMRQAFSKTGLAHVLALSGMHVAIIILALYIILFPLSLFRKHNLRIIITIILLWIYVVMTMFSPSVTRAVIMATFVLMAYVLYRQNVAFNSLCGAALLIIVFSPYSIYNIGFRLSFAAVAGILLLSVRLNPFRMGTLRYKFAAIFTLPLSAVLATAPLMIYHFHQFPLIFILTAPLFTPILTFIISAGMFLLMIGLPSGFMTDAINWCYSFTTEMINFSADFPGVNVTGLYISGISVILLLLAVPLLAALIEYRKVVFGYALVAIGFAVTAVEYFSVLDYPECEHYVLLKRDATNIIIKDGCEMQVITTHKQSELQAFKEECEFRYADYLGKRKMTAVNVVTDKLITKNVKYYHPLLVLPDTRIIIAGADYVIFPNNCDTLIVCNGFRKDVVTLARSVKPKTILFGRDLNPRLRKRYRAELEAAGFKVE